MAVLYQYSAIAIIIISVERPPVKTSCCVIDISSRKIILHRCFSISSSIIPVNKPLYQWTMMLVLQPLSCGKSNVKHCDIIGISLVHLHSISDAPLELDMPFVCYWYITRATVLYQPFIIIISVISVTNPLYQWISKCHILVNFGDQKLLFGPFESY